MRVFIVGASGFLGGTIYNKLKENGNDEILGSCYKAGNPEFIKIDVMNQNSIKEIFSYKPDTIIWSIYDKEKEVLLTRIGLNEIVSNASNDLRLIYVSTTIGRGKDQDEEVIPCFRSQDDHIPNYINGKIEGERIVKKHFNHVIVRPGSIYGIGRLGELDARMEKLLQVSKTGEIYYRTANSYSSYVHVTDLANAIIELIHNDFTGTINVAGEKPISYYDFNIKLAEMLKINNRFILPDNKPKEIYHNLDATKRKIVLKTSIRDL